MSNPPSSYLVRPFEMSEAPSYSAEPSPDEHRVDWVHHSADVTTSPTGTLVHHGPGISIAFKNQLKAARCATYSRDDPVMGEVSLSRVKGISSIVVHVSPAS